MSSFNHIAKHYNAMTGFPGRVDRLAEGISPWVREWNVQRALDAGCGNGVLMFALRTHGVQSVGIDASEAMVRLTLDNARELGVPVDVRSTTYAAVGEVFPSEFDGVFALGNAIVGASDEREMTEWMKGLCTALKPGGHILIQMLNLTPFLLGDKTLIMRRTVGDVTYSRFARPAVGRSGLTFCLTINGPGDAFDSYVSYWPPWERQRVVSCLVEAGFVSCEVYGSMSRDPFDPRTSTDLVIAALRR